MPSFPVLNAAAATTNIQCFTTSLGTVVPVSCAVGSTGNQLIGAAVSAASFPVVIASDQANLTTVLGAALPAGTNAIGTVTIAAGTASVVNLAGTNAIGTVTALQGGAPWSVSGTFTPSAGTAASINTVVSTSGAPAAISVKTTSGTLFGISLNCTNTSYPVFMKLYNATSGAVSTTSTPVLTLQIPPGAVCNPMLPVAGVSFTTAISYIITKNFTSSDTTPVLVGDLLGWVNYL